MKTMNVAEMQNTNAGIRIWTYGTCNYCGYCSGSFGTFGAIYVYKKIEKHCKTQRHFSGARFSEIKGLW